MVREKRHNLLLMAIAVALVGGLAFGSGLQTRDAEVKKALLTASLTLLFGGLLGGFVKLLLDDFDRGRQQRAEEVQFILGALGDLKAVYDRTERTRLLLPAHQSAKTYGGEMRDLIEARVRLLNVWRAIKFQKTREDPNLWNLIASRVELMADYLAELLSGFSAYKEISEEQRRYEVQMDDYAQKAERDPLAAGVPPLNKPWEMIRARPEIRDLLNSTKTNYQSKFVENLDGATEALTQRLQWLLT